RTLRVILLALSMAGALSIAIAAIELARGPTKRRILRARCAQGEPYDQSSRNDAVDPGRIAGAAGQPIDYDRRAIHVAVVHTRLSAGCRAGLWSGHRRRRWQPLPRFHRRH